MAQGNQPIIRQNIGGLKTAVFCETRNDRNGNPYDAYSVAVSKSYQDQNGAWQEQKISLFDNNLLEMAFLLERTYASIMGVKAAKRKKELAERQGQNNQDAAIEAGDIPF